MYVFKGVEANETDPDCLNTTFMKLPRIEGHFPSEFFFHNLYQKSVYKTPSKCSQHQKETSC